MNCQGTYKSSVIFKNYWLTTRERERDREKKKLIKKEKGETEDG